MSPPGRKETWLDGLGEWSWPGVRTPAVEIVPATWVPAIPVPVPAPVGPPAVARPGAHRRTLPRPVRVARLVLLLAIGATTFVLSRGIARPGVAPSTAGGAAALRLVWPLEVPFTPPVERPHPRALAPPAVPAAREDPRAAVLRPGPTAHLARPVARSVSTAAVLAPPPVPVTIGSDHAGSTIASITYRSHALGWTDTYLVYLPPGYHSDTSRRYPVLYLLHGDGQPASSFLRLGLQRTLDQLIDTHAIAPMIAVMLQANGLPDNWRNGSGPQYRSYVGEVQQLTDRTLRTIPARASRGIAGYSMGGFGAMNIALASLHTYSVVESWEGFFNNLSHELAVDKRLFPSLPLHAFVWGGLEDTIASSSEDGPWAEAMRAAGASAESAIYPGTHAFTPLRQHLAQMLSFAGRQLRS
jgi:S-formylglutathione hydrolase FrmB